MEKENTDELKSRIEELEGRVEELENYEYGKYEGWVVDNSLMKRSFAIFGQSMLAYFIILIIFFGLVFIMAIIIGFAAELANA